MSNVFGLMRKRFRDALPPEIKDDPQAVLFLLGAFEQAVPPPPPPVFVQRVDGDGPRRFEVVDRRLPKLQRIVGSFPTEAAARNAARARLPIAGGAYVLSAVDSDEPFHDTDYEVVGNQQRYGVITGCGLTYDAADLTVDLAAGAILHSGAIVSVTAASNAYTLVADGSNERWAALCLSSAGAAVLVSGDAAPNGSTEPTKPEIGDRVLLAMVKIQAAQTIAANAEYKLDKRILIGFPVIQRKAADEVVNNSAALQNDDHFLINVSAGDTVYVKIDAIITQANSGSQGIRVAFTFPTASTAVAGTVGHMQAGASSIDHSRIAPIAITSGTAFDVGVGTTNYTIAALEVWAYFVFTAAGVLQFQWAQNTANATDLTIEAGSICEYIFAS